MQKKCKRCETLFETSLAIQEYCTVQCRRRRAADIKKEKRKETEIRVCSFCQKEFKIKNFMQKFCTKTCTRASHKKVVKCKVCAEPILQNKIAEQKRKYCSVSCEASYFSSLEKKCETCGKKFIRTERSKGRKFCTPECRTSLKKNTSEETVCFFCEKEFIPEFRRQKYCSRVCKINGGQIRTVRNWSIVEEVLVPENTLEAVAQKYGLTRERVRQIFYGVTGVDSPTVKKTLLRESSKFRCNICGLELNKLTFICPSKMCRALKLRYSLDKSLTCDFCKKDFFPRRNREAIKKYVAKIRKIEGTGNFCSTVCFLNSRYGKDKWSEHQVAVFKKIKEKEIDARTTYRVPLPVDA